MNTLQELTDKIYAEGVEKGKEQAAAIVAEAEAKAQEIIAAAEKEAAQKIEVAKRTAQELDKNTRSELRLFADQSVSALKTEIANILSDKVATAAVTSATNESKFMQKLITDLAFSLAKEGQVVIEAADAEALRGYMAANAKSFLDKGIEIREVKGQKTQFTIVPRVGSYKIEFGDEEFITYFKEYLRPQLIELLF